MTLTPQDWLLYIDKGWRKLSTPEEIDAYVDRKTLGYLFIFDAVEKRDDKQVMVGTLLIAPAVTCSTWNCSCSSRVPG